ncbi:MAG: class I SAM-dependent methyltransferase [Clostridia bacterium]|nr:class I SAM-dependent methyltransferase [Clostridia bacterium]
MSEKYWNETYSGRQTGPDIYDGWLDGYAFCAGERVLDLGCGAGTDLERLIACGTAVTAADLSENAVALVKARFGGIHADCFDMLEGFPYPEGSFDTVVSDLSLHYFSWEDTERVIGDIFRILKPGGRLIARVHSVENLPPDAEPVAYGYYRAYGCMRRYFTIGDLEKLFYGWKIDCRETIARRYGLEKRVIEFIAQK